jgi:hypothetical protein
MALWRMERDGNQVRLMYVDHPTSPESMFQKCGEAEVAVMTDLEAWVFDQAAPWDLRTTADGATFVRQTITTLGGGAKA